MRSVLDPNRKNRDVFCGSGQAQVVQAFGKTSHINICPMMGGGRKYKLPRFIKQRYLKAVILRR